MISGLICKLPSRASRLATCSGLRSSRVNLSTSSHSFDEDCLPLIQTRRRSSRIVCACFGRQPHYPLFRLTSREIVDLCTPVSFVICVWFQPDLLNPEIRYRYSWLSCVYCFICALFTWSFKWLDVDTAHHLNLLTKVALQS